jgi:hypothetical protein
MLTISTILLLTFLSIKIIKNLRDEYFNYKWDSSRTKNYRHNDEWKLISLRFRLGKH